MSYRVWVIGLDGGTFDLILPWVEQGHLPVIGRLLREGAWGEVRSTIPPITGPAWSTFMTGVNPGKHGVFDWVFRRKGTYDFPPVTGEHIRQPSLWRIASDAGKRVLSINVPMTFPPEVVNGNIVSGLPATNLVTYPKSLAQEILEQIPDYVVYPDPGQAYSDQGIQAFLKRLELSNRGLLELWQMLVEREDWDLAMMVFNATDVVSHAMWKFMDDRHPQYDPVKAVRYKDAILKIYIEMDQALGKIISMMDEQTVLMVMSDHGFGPFHKFIHVNTWLLQEGFLSVRQGLFPQIKSALFRLGLSPMAVYDYLMKIGLGKLKREVVRGRGQGMLRTFFLSFEDVDWSRTVAYSLGNIGQIRINLRGREPQGCVSPGAEYEKVVEEIIHGLEQLRDPKTGEKVVEKIARRSEVYWGEAAEDGADILFIPTRLEYFGFGEYEFGDHHVIAAVNRGISGTHRMNGIGMAWGKPIIPSRLQGARLEDISPSILHLMGLPVPSHMDGRPMIEMLSPESGLAQPVIGPALTGRSVPTNEMDDADEEIVRKRLRDLGYVA